ncbi:MAG: hypothetical protein QF553_05420, partial [Alphaproteobacteria bacterium]|nr:hypothetical protein [Alphaproteobacteria bacterium]
MSESKGWVAVFVLLVVGIFLAHGANRGAETTSPRGPGLGHGVSLETAAAWDISIPPDGHNLPPGSGTVADGEKLYRERC